MRDQLEDLLGGKMVYLLDDVNRSGIRKYNALKFNLVDLHLVSNDEAKDMLLQQSAMVSLTDMGESKYRCNQKFYTLSTQPQNISYSFLKENGEPVIKNHMYEKLRTGERLLSPYTFWAMQLSCLCVEHRATNENSKCDCADFEKLKSMADFVDRIELHGRGQFVHHLADILNTDLEKYYSPVL